MPSRIALPPDQLQVVRQILQAHLPGREIRAFGSRVMGQPKPMSDLDLCVMQGPPLTGMELEQLRIAFAESSLPIKVDVVDWTDLSPVFQTLLQRTSVVLQRAA